MKSVSIVMLAMLTVVGCRPVEPTGMSPAANTSASAAAPPAEPPPIDPRMIRQAIFDELRPVALRNCTLKRYGGPNDGGYVMCSNLLDGVEGVYSYGIATEDNWGCQASRQIGPPVHQYDCFTVFRPPCRGIRPVFHNECIGPRTETKDGRPYDTLANQIVKNGHAGKRVLVKMDVEGAEWDSLMSTPDEVLERIDQLPLELHGANERRFLDTIRKLKQHFYLVTVHFNNHACDVAAAPLPAWAYQVLLVNKRLGIVDPSGRPHQPADPPNAPDARDLKKWPDCQPRWQ